MECSRDRKEDRGSSIPSSEWEVEERAEGGGRSRWSPEMGSEPTGGTGAVGIALELLSLQHCHVPLQFQGMQSEEGPLGSPPEQLHFRLIR